MQCLVVSRVHLHPYLFLLLLCIHSVYTIMTIPISSFMIIYAILKTSESCINMMLQIFAFTYNLFVEECVSHDTHRRLFRLLKLFLLSPFFRRTWVHSWYLVGFVLLNLFVFCVVFCKSLFVFLSLYCLSFIDQRLLTSLVYLYLQTCLTTQCPKKK